MVDSFRELLRQRLAQGAYTNVGGPIPRPPVPDPSRLYPGGAAQAYALARPGQADPMRISDPAAGNWAAKYEAAQKAAALRLAARLTMLQAGKVRPPGVDYAGGGGPVTANDVLGQRGPVVIEPRYQDMARTAPARLNLPDFGGVPTGPVAGQAPVISNFPANDQRSPLFPRYRAALEAGLSEQDAVAYAIDIATKEDPVAAASIDAISSGAEKTIAGANAAIESPVGEAVGWVGTQYDKARVWNNRRTADAMYTAAMTGDIPDPTVYGFYKDGSIEGWSLNPENKEKIKQVYEVGLDLNEDGTVDIKGADALYMVYTAEVHPGFIDNLINEMGNDPLFAASFIAPAASAGRSYAQAAEEVALIAGLPRAQKIARAVDKLLAGATKAGDVGNAIADAPFTIPAKVVKSAAKGVKTAPGTIQSFGRGIGWLAEPSDATAARIATNDARDAAQSAVNANDTSGVTIPPREYPYGPPQPPEMYTGDADFVAGPGGGIYRAPGSTSDAPPTASSVSPAPMPRDVPGQSRPGVGPYMQSGVDGVPIPPLPESFGLTPPGKPSMQYGPNVYGDMPNAGLRDFAEPPPPDIPVRKSNSKGVPTATVGLNGDVRVVARDGGVWEVQVKKNGRWKGAEGFNDESTAIDRAKEIVRAGTPTPDVTPPLSTADTPVQQPIPDTTPAVGGEAMPDPVVRGKSFLLEDQPKKGPTWKSWLADNHPDTYAKIRTKLDPVVNAYEYRINNAPTKIDGVIETGAWAATLKKAAREEGVDIPIPWQRSVRATDPGARNATVQRIDRIIYEPDPKMAAADRNVMYARGELRKSPPREELANEIVAANLPKRKGWDKITVTERGERVTYTNRALSAMPIEERVRISELAIAEQTLAYQRYTRIEAIRNELHGPYSSATPSPESLSFANPSTMMAGDAMQSGQDALKRALLGDPVAPSVPRNPLAQGELGDYRDFSRSELLGGMEIPAKFKRMGEIDDASFEYFHQIVGEGDEARSAWDVFADVVDKHIVGVDTNDIKAINAAKRAIVDDYAKAMREITGKPVPPKVRKNLLGRGLAPIFRSAGILNEIARQGLLFNIVTGPRGWAQDVISNMIKVTWEGNAGAAFEALNVNQLIKVMRNEGDALDALAARYGFDVPDELNIYGKFDTTAGIDRTAINRTISDTAGFKEGTWQDRTVGLATAPLSTRWIAKGRAAHENLIRRAMMMDEFEQLIPAASREFRAWGRKWAERYGVMPSSFDAYMYEIGDDITPTSVRMTMGELGTDAGLAESAAEEFANKVATQWEKTVNTARNQAYAKTRKALFTYEKTNLDEFIGKFFFYHYWMTRSIPSYARLALHNPEIAAMWFRAWNEVSERAEKDGYPPSLVGYLRFMGNTTEGFFHAYNPLQFFMPFDLLRQDPFADTTWETITQFAMVSPSVQAIAAVVGATDSAPDLLGTYAVRGLVVSALNKLRGEGVIGEARLQGDWYDSAMRYAFGLANDIAVKTGAPMVNDVTFFGANVYNSQLIDYAMREVVEDQTGMPFSENSPNWQPGGEAFELWADAKRDFAAGDDNDIAKAGYAKWADANWRNQALKMAMPGGVRMRSGERDADRSWFRDLTTTGSPEAFDLSVADREYKNIGTPRQRQAHDSWTAIAYDDVPPGMILQVGGQSIRSEDLMKMTRDQRIELADQWIAQYDATGDLAKYQADRKAFIEKHPEYGDYDEYRKAVYNEDNGGPRKYRTDQARVNAGFKAAMDRERADLIKYQGLSGEPLEESLDHWAANLDGYQAAIGVRGSAYDPPPGEARLPSDVTPIGDATSGGAKAKTTPLNPMEKVRKNITDYVAEAEAAKAKLRAMGYSDNLEELQANPYYAPFLSQFNIPELKGDAKLYFDWLVFNPGKSVDDFIRYLEELAARQPAA